MKVPITKRPKKIALPRIKEICLDANNEHADVLKATATAVKHAIRCGELLKEAKALVGHGNFLPWLKDNFAGGQRTAQVYMWLAANTQRAADFNSIRAAVAAAEKPFEETKEIVAELVEEPSRKAQVVKIPGQERPVIVGGRPLPLMQPVPQPSKPKPAAPELTDTQTKIADGIFYVLTGAREHGLSDQEIWDLFVATFSVFVKDNGNSKPKQSNQKENRWITK